MPRSPRSTARYPHPGSTATPGHGTAATNVAKAPPEIGSAAHIGWEPDAEWAPPAPAPIRGRGAAENPTSRFDRLGLHYFAGNCAGSGAGNYAGSYEGTGTGDFHEEDAPAPSPRTIYLRDPTRTALAHNQSPDINFDSSLNPYRGCEHGCVYCYARPTHEYLGFSAGLDFETRILVKEDAPELLRRELSARRWKPQVVGLSGVTDPYQPIERRLQLTRQCLRVFADFRNPVQLITKNGLIARDVDLLAELAEHDAASAAISVTTLDAKLHHIMEPRTSHPAQRLQAIEALAKAGIPVSVMVAPVVPAINDHEIPAILQAAADAGARYAGHIVLRLPHGVKDLFTAWLERHFPDRRDKVLNRLRSLRGGRLNDPTFGARMKGAGIFADQIHDLFELWRRKSGIEAGRPALSTAAFRLPGDSQLKLF